MAEEAVTVIRYPINNAFADTELTPAGAKRRLGLREDGKAILLLGRIVPYKGIESLLDAFRLLLEKFRSGTGHPEDAVHSRRRDGGVPERGRCSGPSLQGDIPERRSVLGISLWPAGGRD